MKTNFNLLQTRIFCAVALATGSFFGLAAATEVSADTASATTAFPWSQLGVKAGVDYQGDALAVIATAEGARLRCVFQRLEGEATREGLWLTSTVTNAVNVRFRLVAVEVGRGTPSTLRSAATEDGCAPSAVDGATDRSANIQPSTSGIQLSATGTVSIDGQSVLFTRPGLVEEYTASTDGVRQDFVVLERPPGLGELVLRLAVSGASVESAAFGAQVVLANSGRKIAYNRLKVTDANGRELPARMEVATAPESKIGNQKSEILRVVVNDAEAVYPVRIDPTFSDANWSSMGGIPGANGSVYAAVVDDSGNLYIGGGFTIAGEIVANSVAKWNGSSWSALGSGMDGSVIALAVSGSDLYAGGFGSVAKWDGISWSALGSGMDYVVFDLAVLGNDVYAAGGFSTAGGIAASGIAKWNGSTWTALGSGMNDYVTALAVSGSNLYAGGQFSTAGGSAANYIAKWSGSSWSALGSSGLSGGDYPQVNALAVSGGNVYVGGNFTTASGNAASNVAKWNGSSWSALGSGIDGQVAALAVSGSNVYAGGWFTIAGGSTANYIAKWNGSNWSALGSGMNQSVYTLAVSGSDLYAGGYFTTAGGSAAKYIAKWNGTNWSALGSGIDSSDPRVQPSVSALAVSGSDLYVGGFFTTAGGIAANSVAKWNGSSWSALGSGIGGDYPEVYALAVSGNDLYAAGAFTTAGGSAATNIAKWNGSSWSALGSGLASHDYYPVFELAVSGSDLYAGGFFTTAGGKESAYIARAYLPALPTLSVLRSGNRVTVFWPTVDTAGFALEQAGPLAAPAGWVTNSTTVTDDGANKSVTLPATNSPQFFRLRRP